MIFFPANYFLEIFDPVTDIQKSMHKSPLSWVKKLKILRTNLKSQEIPTLKLEVQTFFWSMMHIATKVNVNLGRFLILDLESNLEQWTRPFWPSLHFWSQSNVFAMLYIWVILARVKFKFHREKEKHRQRNRHSVKERKSNAMHWSVTCQMYTTTCSTPNMTHANCKVAHLFNLTLYVEINSLIKSEQFESTFPNLVPKEKFMPFMSSFEFWVKRQVKKGAQEICWWMLEVVQSGNNMGCVLTLY